MQVFRYSDGVLPNSLLFVYLVTGTTLSIHLLLLKFSVLNQAWFVEFGFKILVSVYLAHLMVLAAYLAHECMHNTIFKSPSWNHKLGLALCWILGAAHQPYIDLKNKHLRHHTERRDVLLLDYRRLLAKHARLKSLIQLLQWSHLPVAEIFTHALSVWAPFSIDTKKHLRTRTAVVLISRLVFWLALCWVDVWLLFGYGLAYVLCITVLGFMDAYQHTYDVALSLDEEKGARVYDRAYEEEHTFSNLLSVAHPAINLLVLNFCYHNIHHWKSGEPWYRLPKLQQQRYQQECPQWVGFQTQIKNYHQYRMVRIEVDSARSEQQAQAIGASGVSFLVGV